MEKPSRSYIIKDIHPEDDFTLLQMQRLRYRVYHDEMKARFGRPWIPSNPLKLDVDGWDDYAIQHFGAYTEDNRLIGSLRLTSGQYPYMFDVFYDDLFVDLDGIQRSVNACESSRLTVATAARGDGTKFKKGPMGFNLMVRACQYCIENGIDWWYGVTTMIDSMLGFRDIGIPVDEVKTGILNNSDQVLLYLFNKVSLNLMASIPTPDVKTEKTVPASIDFQDS